jgi:hypothetical protein
MVGDRPEFKRYMIIVTPKGMERERVNAQTFSFFVGDSLRELGEPAPAGKSFTEYLDLQPPGKASLLAELRRGPELVSVLQGTRLPQPQGRSNEKPQYLVSTTTLMLLRGKALNLSVYGAYDSTSDLDWIRSITVRWIEELQRLNTR